MVIIQVRTLWPPLATLHIWLSPASHLLQSLITLYELQLHLNGIDQDCCRSRCVQSPRNSPPLTIRGALLHPMLMLTGPLQLPGLHIFLAMSSCRFSLPSASIPSSQSIYTRTRQIDYRVWSQRRHRRLVFEHSQYQLSDDLSR